MSDHVENRCKNRNAINTLQTVVNAVSTSGPQWHWYRHWEVNERSDKQYH